IHAGAMPFSVRCANQTSIINRQSRKSGKVAGQQRSLIEAAHSFPLRVLRHRHDPRRSIERRTPVRFEQQLPQTPGQVRLSLEREHGSAQSAFIESAGARGREYFCVTAPASHLLSLILGNTAEREYAALPTQRLV